MLKFSPWGKDEEFAVIRREIRKRTKNLIVIAINSTATGTKSEGGENGDLRTKAFTDRGGVECLGNHSISKLSLIIVNFSILIMIF